MTEKPRRRYWSKRCSQTSARTRSKHNVYSTRFGPKIRYSKYTRSCYLIISCYCRFPFVCLRNFVHTIHSFTYRNCLHDTPAETTRLHTLHSCFVFERIRTISLNYNINHLLNVHVYVHTCWSLKRFNIIIFIYIALLFHYFNSSGTGGYVHILYDRNTWPNSCILVLYTYIFIIINNIFIFIFCWQKVTDIVLTKYSRYSFGPTDNRRVVSLKEKKNFTIFNVRYYIIVLRLVLVVCVISLIWTRTH